MIGRQCQNCFPWMTLLGLRLSPLWFRWFFFLRKIQQTLGGKCCWACLWLVSTQNVVDHPPCAMCICLFTNLRCPEIDSLLINQWVAQSLYPDRPGMVWLPPFVAPLKSSSPFLPRPTLFIIPWVCAMTLSKSQHFNGSVTVQNGRQCHVVLFDNSVVLLRTSKVTVSSR